MLHNYFFCIGQFSCASQYGRTTSGYPIKRYRCCINNRMKAFWMNFIVVPFWIRADPNFGFGTKIVEIRWELSETSLLFYKSKFADFWVVNFLGLTSTTTSSYYYSATFCDNSDCLQKYANRFITKRIWYHGQPMQKMQNLLNVPSTMNTGLNDWLRLNLVDICLDNALQVLCKFVSCFQGFRDLTGQKWSKVGL